MAVESRTVAGKYVLGERIAAGGMGEVYAARHVETERRVAIKILRGDSIPQPEAVERLRREARAAGRIGHDNICDVLDLGRFEDGTPYLVMPLLHGRTLAAVLHEAGPLPLRRCVDIGAQILAGLAAAHAAGIVHRDLKPQNVFLVRMGDRDDFVKILDFGISKSLAPTPTDGSLTQTGIVVGTPNYMAPEQIRGRKNIDHRVDLYAAGVLLYQMTTAHLPFQGDSYGAIVSAILLDPFPLPRRLRPDLPEALEAVILRAMARDRRDRFPDAHTMRAALLAALPEHQADASGPEPTQPGPAVFGETGPIPSTPTGHHTPTGNLQSVSTNSTTTHHRRRRIALAAALAVTLAAGAATLLLLESPHSTAPAAPPTSLPLPTTGHHPVTPIATTGTPPATPDTNATTPAANAATPAAPPPPPTADTTTRPASNAESTTAPPAATPPPAPTVEIRLVGLPAGARVEVDGRPARDNPLRLPRADTGALVEVSAPGCRPWRAEIPRSEDRTVAVRLVATRNTGDAAPHKTRDAGPGTAPAGTAQTDDTTTSNPGDPRPVRPGTVPDYSLGP